MTELRRAIDGILLLLLIAIGCALSFVLVAFSNDLSWLLWAVMLLMQNASFTLVSRARNTGSLFFHAIASVPSNGIYFLNFIVGVAKIGPEVFKHGMTLQAWGLIAFYTTFTVLGSITMHHISMTYLEKGRARIGGRG